jgi:hypothetical protein
MFRLIAVNMQFALPASAQRYLKYFQPLKIIALLEIPTVSKAFILFGLPVHIFTETIFPASDPKPIYH